MLAKVITSRFSKGEREELESLGISVFSNVSANDTLPFISLDGGYIPLNIFFGNNRYRPMVSTGDLFWSDFR